MLKRFSLSILVVIALCFSCKKNNDSDQKVNEENIVNRIAPNEYLKLIVNDYLEEKVRGSIEIETKYFSLAPFKMFYRSFFSSREERVENWINTFNRNGLSKVDLENYINQQITIYNKQNSQFAPLPQIKLSEINTHEIIDEKAFEALDRLEFFVWYSNIWFDCLFTFTLVIAIGLIGNLLFPIRFGGLPYLISGKMIIGWAIFLMLLDFKEVKSYFINLIIYNYSSIIFN